MSSLETLMRKLNYHFKNSKLLETAVTHKSFGNENLMNELPDHRDNERLELLGDAVLDLIITEMLLIKYKYYSEGDLSKLRAYLVNEHALSVVASELDIGKHILFGKGEEQTGGAEKESILASTLEAIVAAIYLDGGFDSTKRWIEHLFKVNVENADTAHAFGDYKTKLQEIVQAQLKSAPKYEVVSSSGPDHDKTFEIRLVINGSEITVASGKSKKEAEQNAAKAALERLTKIDV